jgi:hypothetical protein
MLPLRRLLDQVSSQSVEHQRWHLLNTHIHHTPEGISTKRAKSSLAVVTVPECNIELQSHGDGSSKPSQDRPDYQKHLSSLEQQSKGKLIQSPARVEAFNVSGAKIQAKVRKIGNIEYIEWEKSDTFEVLHSWHEGFATLRGPNKSNSKAEGSGPSPQSISREGTRQRDANRPMNSPNTRRQESLASGKSPFHSPSETSTVKDNPRTAYPPQVSTTNINSDMSIFCETPSLVDLLKVIKQKAPNWLAQFPQRLQRAKALEALLPSDEETIRKKEDAHPQQGA